MSFTTKDHTQFFARIRLHGLTKSSTGTPCPIDLDRRTSFPMPADRLDVFKNGQHNKDLSACQLAPVYDIEARVCFEHPIIQDHAERNESSYADSSQKFLGSGRAGIVYPLEISSFNRVTSYTSIDGNTSSEEPRRPPKLPPLCIKVATPGYARNLAREAWFYEQLDARDLTGFVVPRCYGVFHASNLPDGVTLDVPGYDYYRKATKPISEHSKLYTAPMYEEEYDEDANTLIDNTTAFMDDVKNSYAHSEWRQFRETPLTTTVTVLVMDMLGANITKDEFEKEWDEEINDIWDHFAPLDILHEDVRFPNFLRVPPHLQVPCPMHPNAGPGHRWNLTDWEGASILCRGTRNSIGLWDQRLNMCSYYRRVGGKLKLSRSYEDYFEIIDFPDPEKRSEYIYVGYKKNPKNQLPKVQVK